jgi:hypothetical protein
VPVMRVEGEEPLSSGLKGLESGVREPSCLKHVVFVVMPCRAGPRWLWPTPGTRTPPPPVMNGMVRS